MSLSSRIKDVRHWLHNAKERYFGARHNLRIVRQEIHGFTKTLRAIQERLPNAQGGVRDDLRAQEAKLKDKIQELQKRQKKVAEQVENRKEIYEKLEKKLKRLQEAKDEQVGGGDPSSSVGFSIPVRSWNPYGRQIPNWMIPWLDKSRENGWTGVVVSGVRTPEYSESLCYGMCGRPSCPGTCAGRASNHNMVASQGYPDGALDVSDYYTFERVQWAIGSPLKNDLPNDAVHFSVSGH